MSNQPNVLVVTFHPRERPASPQPETPVEPKSQGPAPADVTELGRFLAAYQEQQRELTIEGAELKDRLILSAQENDRLRRLMAEVVTDARKDRDEVTRLRRENKALRETPDPQPGVLAQMDADLAEARLNLQQARACNENAIAALQGETRPSQA